MEIIPIQSRSLIAKLSCITIGIGRLYCNYRFIAIIDGLMDVELLVSHISPFGFTRLHPRLVFLTLDGPTRSLYTIAELAGFIDHLLSIQVRSSRNPCPNHALIPHIYFIRLICRDLIASIDIWFLCHTPGLMFACKEISFSIFTFLFV